MTTIVDSQSKQNNTNSAPIPASVPVTDDSTGVDGTWIKSVNSSRRSSLAGPPGLSHPSQNGDIPMPKLTRAASVSFLSPLPNTTQGDNYLRQLAEATSLMQSSQLSQSKWKPDIWSNDSLQRRNNWSGLESNYNGQHNFNSSLHDGVRPLRRMSLNPGGSLLPVRPRLPSQTNNPLNVMPKSYTFQDLDNFSVLNNNLNSLDNSNYNYSRRESLSSPPLASHSVASTDSIGASSNGTRFSRRYSLAPQYGNDWDFEDQLSYQLDNLMMENYASIVGRRHSVAASAFPPRLSSPPTPSDQPEYSHKIANQAKEQYNELPSQYKLDLTNNSNSPTKESEEIYYVVEFKGGRIDTFYNPPDSTTTYKVGDLVIVEADRGQDLGKIIRDNINSTQLISVQESIRARLADTQRNLEPKKLYRHAHPSEVNHLVNKCQDEAKAVQLCLMKLRQHNLPMEIVDAEYQWDRRKLTFFYRAEDRIDFRELVRELFKVYKTRIWMCAVAN